MTLSTRIGVMNEGRIVQVGTPGEIYEFPGTRFVAEFIGSVNMFDGRISVDEPDHVVISSEQAGCDILIDHGIATAPGAGVSVAIRPEKISMARQAPGESTNVTRGVIEEIAYMGGLSIYQVKLDSGHMVRVTQPNLFRQPEDTFTWEDTVYLGWHSSSPVVLSQ